MIPHYNFVAFCIGPIRHIHLTICYVCYAWISWYWEEHILANFNVHCGYTASLPKTVNTVSSPIIQSIVIIYACETGHRYSPRAL